MATIDAKKLLPPSKKTENSEKFLVPVTSIVPKRSVTLSANALRPVDKPADAGTSVSPSDNLVSKIVKVENILKSNLALQIKEGTRKDKEEKNKEAEEKEKKLEIKDDKKSKVPLPSLPRTGFLDALRNYFINTLLGFVAVKLFDMAPKLIKFLDATKPIITFIGFLGKNLFDGFVGFIENGYKAYDEVRKFTKTVGGENAQKLFDEFSKNLNLVLNGAIVAAGLAISTAPRTPAGRTGAGTGAASGAVKGASQILERGSLSRLNASYANYIAGNANIGDRARLLRRGFIGGRQALSKGGEKALQQGAARKSAQEVAKQAATQGAKQSAKFAITKAPIIGALIGFIIDTVIFKEKPTRAAAGAVGNAIGSAVGAGLLGGGTFGLGAGVGLFVGGWVGDWIGKSLYDTIASMNQEPVQGRAQGGQISTGGRTGTPTRSIKKTRRPVKRITPQKTQPGKDAGGLRKIEELYGTDEPGTRSALRALKKSSQEVKRVKSINGLSGAMFGAGIDMALGQKPDKNLARSLGDMFGSVVQNAIDVEMNSAFSDITKTLAMANGGVVPQRGLRDDMNIGERIGRYVSNAFSVAIENSASKVFENLRKELNLEGAPGESPYDQEPPSGEPLEYEVSGGELPSSYSGRGTESHGYPGRDYQIAVGKAITVFKPGTVTYAQLNSSGYGNLVIIKHKDGTQTVYAHLSRINTREGDEIKQGEKKVIGLTGGAAGAPGAGNSTGPHLHFEVRNSAGRQVTKYNDGDAYFRFGTVTGVRKRTPLEMSKLKVEPTGRELQGEISWYGPGFYGNKTSNGETYTGNEMTAAHKTLPFGTLVRVTWKGRSIVVRINDRGPFIPGRVLDLSRKAAQELGMSGVANGAKIEIVRAKPDQSPPPQLGKVLSSTNVNGSTYTVREGGQYFKNGSPITQDEYDRAFGLQLSSVPSQQSSSIASLTNLSKDADIDGSTTTFVIQEIHYV